VRAFIVELQNRPGGLAALAEAIAERGINITNLAGVTCGGSGSVGLLTNDEASTKTVLDAGSFSYRQIDLISAALEDKPGTLGAAARRLADAGVNIELLLPTGMGRARDRIPLTGQPARPSAARATSGTSVTNPHRPVAARCCMR